MGSLGQSVTIKWSLEMSWLLGHGTQQAATYCAETVQAFSSSIDIFLSVVVFETGLVDLPFISIMVRGNGKTKQKKTFPIYFQLVAISLSFCFLHCMMYKDYADESS